MTPNQLYALPPIQTLNDPYLLHSHIRDVDFSDIEAGTCDVECRYYARNCTDGERVWELFSVWYDGKPFMICQAAGRGGRDHSEMYITDHPTYLLAVAHLRTLIKPKDPAEFDWVVKPGDELEGLDKFYGDRLSNLYDPALVPKLKVGDIVMASVPINHFNLGMGCAPQRVRIDHANPYRARELYRGKRLDWRWGSAANGEDSRVMVYDKDNGGVWTVFHDKDVLEVLEHAKEEKPDGA